MPSTKPSRSSNPRISKRKIKDSQPYRRIFPRTISRDSSGACRNQWKTPKRLTKWPVTGWGNRWFAISSSNKFKCAMKRSITSCSSNSSNNWEQPWRCRSRPSINSRTGLTTNLLKMLLLFAPSRRSMSRPLKPRKSRNRESKPNYAKTMIKSSRKNVQPNRNSSNTTKKPSPRQTNLPRKRQHSAISEKRSNRWKWTRCAWENGSWGWEPKSIWKR